MGGGGGIGQVDVIAVFELEIAKAEGGEDQLAGEAQIVDGFRAVVGAEGAKRRLVLAQQDVFLRPGAEVRVLVLAARGLGPAGLAQLVLVDGQGVIARQHLGGEIGIEAVRQLHQVGVGVVNDLVLHVGHGASSSFSALWLSG